MINYSIIIPHKNIPNLLQRCLDSIPNREDVQIIVVDDNSDPNIVDFDKFPGLNRSNVEVIFTKEGKGAGYARNTGIKYVKGKWLLFSDADDYFSENVNRLFDDYENSVMDVIYIPYKTIDLITGEDLEDGLCVTNLEEDLYKKRSDTLRYRCYSPWAKMVKVSMIERYSIRFEEVVASNDVWFSVNVGYVAKEIDICNYIVYIRNVRYGSLQYSLNKEYLLSRIKVGYKVNDFLYDINKIVYYADQNGEMQKKPQRKVLIIADMIVSGQGNGPLNPHPKNVGMIVIGDNPVYVDETIAKVMGFDSRKIPTLQLIKKTTGKKYSLLEKDEEILIRSNTNYDGKRLDEIVMENIDAFEPASGWKDHIELIDKGVKTL